VLCLQDGALSAAAEALALLADSEEFSTFPDRYLENDDTCRALVQWRGTCTLWAEKMVWCTCRCDLTNHPRRQQSCSLPA